MLDFFVIFSKSGIVLFATVQGPIHSMVNGLIKHILEEQVGQYQTERLQLKYKMDNEFHLVFVAGYQKMLTLSYVDKFLDDIQLAFRDKFSDFDLIRLLMQKKKENLIEFHDEFARCYRKNNIPKQAAMRTFQDSSKSKKTVSSLFVQNNNTNNNNNAKEVKENKEVKETKEDHVVKKVLEPMKKKAKQATTNAQAEAKKKGKAARKWDLSGSNPEDFDFSKKPTDDQAASNKDNVSSIAKNIASATLARQDIETNLDITDSETSDEEEDEEEQHGEDQSNQKRGPSYLGSIWKTISYNKALTQDDLKPILEQLQEHLTAKNVASEIAEKLCESVGQKLEGQQVNTWIGLKVFVRKSLEESVLRILSPNRSVNVLHEIQTKRNLPYVIVFCGVNGVGKSTNLAKIANWLISNKIRVLIVACDTFRAGAIEQLRTHVQALKSLHELDDENEASIELFERGYGKDSAAIAMEAINYARSRKYNCVMVDTAGRMQDNEPLMKQLAKLIKINAPDLTLFVGEALVGNEAVDQLTKFNNSLLDSGCRAQNSTRSAINGIVLTKFDTIDDQVGAAISMTYVTGQPIVFVGVGQTYKDLKQLDAKAVTKALMR